MHCVCRVFRQLAGEQAEAEEFPSTFLSSYALSTRLQSMHMQAGGSLPASLDAELAPGHLLAVCLEEQRLVQAPPASSSEIAGMKCHTNRSSLTGQYISVYSVPVHLLCRLSDTGRVSTAS